MILELTFKISFCVFISIPIVEMEGGIDADACLDYATIQIFPNKNRYEIFICGDDEVEKLAVGKLEQLLPHLPGVNGLNAKGSNAIFKLQVSGEPNNASWFTKSTLNRFLQVVGPYDLVNTSKNIEGEISQLEEARKFHLSLYAQGRQDNPEGGERDGCNSTGIGSTTEAEGNNASSDASKNELLRAMDLRLTALRSELAAVLDQAVGATCSSKDISDLINFCEHFGATDLKNSLCTISELSQKSMVVDNKTTSASVARMDNGKKNDDDAQKSRTTYSVPPVKYDASPAKAAQIERQSSTESEESSESSDEKNVSAERSRSVTRAAAPRRSASPMRRIQIGRSGSRKPAALTIKSLSFIPARERISQRDAAASSSEDEGTEQPVNKLENNVRRMSVQDAINLFERKQKDQTTDVNKRSSAMNASLSANKSVLRRWSAGVAECSTPSQEELDAEEVVPLPSSDQVNREVSKDVAEEKLDSDFTYGCQNPVTTKVDVQSERWEKSPQDPVNNDIDIKATQGEETNGKLTASAEWSRQKELELNQMLMKMMESQPARSRRSQTNLKQDIPTEQRGGFYNHYKEKRDKKLQGENAEKKAEKEAQFRAMQKILDKRKAEMVLKNVKDVGKKVPAAKPQKSLNNPPQPANPRNGSPKTSGTKKVSSRPSTLPATRKSWPSTPSSRAAVSSPAKTPTTVSSASNTPTSRKPQPVSSVPRSSTKVEKPQPRVRNAKEVQAGVEKKSIKSVKEVKPQTIAKSGRSTVSKKTAASLVDTPKVSAKPSLYNKVTKKSSVVPLESKPLPRKVSGTSPGVGPTMNKTKQTSQSEESSRNCEIKRETQETEVVVDTSVLVNENHGQDTVPSVRCDDAVESETPVDSHQGGVEENLSELSPCGDGGFKGTAGSSEIIQPLEESVISPTAWVEIEEQQDLSNSYNDATPQLNSPVRMAPSPYTRHSLSQMLQEDNNSEPDTVEWGNAENPPTVVYQKDAPKGLKRLLKFARKSKGDANLTGWSSPSVYSEGEDDAEESKAGSKKYTDNLLRKAALHSRDYGQRNTSSFEGYEKKMNVHELLSASRSFFSLSAFRGSKPNDTKFQ
ncbi:hypothetical protein Tsubulata_014053 [Turnera subulata]|uniref:COP1-interacting protein 7 n=1 Tax=Turnera subulata TaxID=218843 RepID=A0A9Q0JQ70_9ROSI|nr:hypothetical protein Tsubulata_014053 [Turnera subulata]